MMNPFSFASIRRRVLRQPETPLVALLLLPLVVLLALIAVFSLSWRMTHDTPLLHYVALLIDKYHFALYRDVFETSMPGTFFFHLAIGKLLGYGDLAFRLVDMAWLGLLGTITFSFMKAFGRRVAWAGTLLFALSYYQLGHNAILQRDYLGVLPLAAAIWLTITPNRLPARWRAFFIGALFGAAATVKPHLALGLVALFFLPGSDGEEKAGSYGRSLRRSLPPAFVGFLLPLFFCLLWLWRMGSLPYFWEMLTSYLPLHVQLSGEHHLLLGREKVRYLLDGFMALGGHALWLLPALSGAVLALRRGGLSARQRRAVWLLAALALVYSIYPVLSGQFWDYHWIPFLYGLILLGSLALAPLPEGFKPKWLRLVPVAILMTVTVLALRPPADFMLQLRGIPIPAPKQGVVDELARVLRAKVGPDDLVQPLDWVGGSIHAMLLARTRIATPFLYDYHFYHHVSNPFIQRLRKRFIAKLETTRPKLIIEVTSMHKGKVGGHDSSTDFPQLRRLLATSYKVWEKCQRYTIYKRR